MTGYIPRLLPNTGIYLDLLFNDYLKITHYVQYKERGYASLSSSYMKNLRFFYNYLISLFLNI